MKNLPLPLPSAIPSSPVEAARLTPVYPARDVLCMQASATCIVCFPTCNGKFQT